MAGRAEKGKRKLVVKEVSLAARPKNKEDFILIYDGEEEMNEDLKKFVSTLAIRCEVPEVVREELRQFAVMSNDQLAAFATKAWPVVSYEEELGALKLEYDNLKLGNEKLKLDNEGLARKNKELRFENLKAEVGDYVEVIEKVYDKLDDSEISLLVSEYKKLKKSFDDLGTPIGDSEPGDLDVTDIDDYRSKIKQLNR